VARERLKESEARSFFRQIVSALKYVHEMGYCHRDLKPENLLLDDDGNIKLIDFGLCGEPESITDWMETSCGSPAYAAPELIQGLKYHGPKADAWSLGVLLYALLNGFLPFDDEHTAYLYELIKKGDYDVPEWLSQGSIHILAQLLKTRPDKRISIDDLLIHPWLLKDNDRPVDWKSRIDLKELDMDVINVMADFNGKSSEETLSEVRKWNYDSTGTTYFLLLQQKRRGEKPHYKIPKLRIHHVLQTTSPPPSPLAIEKKVPLSNNHLQPEKKINGVTASNGDDTDEPSAPPIPQPRKLSIGATPSIPTGELTNLMRLVQGHPQVRKIVSVDEEKYVKAKPPPPFLELSNSVKQTVSYDDRLHIIAEGDESKVEVKRSQSIKPPSTPQPTKRGFFTKVMKKLHPGKTEAGPKEVKGQFTVSTTSLKTPDVVLDTLMQVLTKRNIPFTRKDYKLRCKPQTTRGSVEFELEVCQLRRLDMRGVRRKRLHGDVWVYKTVCDEVVKDANL
jgi:maternal embryonic leucine zipper kinase